MPKVNLSLQVIPLVPEEKVYQVVNQVISLIDDSGVNYLVGPLETTMEGELEELLELVKQSQEICTRAGATRVLSVVKIDYKPEGVTMDEKISQYR
ncbi:MAG TPA: thiamine-binding protein [Clostridia bacterium]|nr:thiamine-binding protein [Clostridia bacterium]